MSSSSSKFKIILLNMKQEELLDLICRYDQYVSNMNEIRAEDEDCNMFTLNLEDFYYQVFK